MNPLEQISQQLLGGLSGGMLWAVHEPTLMQIVSRPRSLHRMYAPQSVDDLVTMEGDTAVISVRGVMVKQAEFSDEVSTPVIEQAVRQLSQDKDVRNVLLDIDSPGGSTEGQPELADALTELRSAKPVIAQASGMIASGAYFLAAGADKIYARRQDWIGSIGTRILLYDFSALFNNIGVKPIPIDTGPLKSTGAMGTEITEDQQAYLQGLVDSFQQEFADVVMRGRGFSAEQFADVATGGIFVATDARKKGLIDGIRTKAETLAAMPKRRSSTTSMRSESMAENNQQPPEEQAATPAQLKKAFPNASSDFLMEQLGAEATLTDAYKAYADHLEAENAKLAEEKEAAAKQAEEAEKKAAAKQQTSKPATRGNKLSASQAEGEEVEAESLDYRQMAEDYMQKHKCRWFEACLEIKRRYPEAREFFGAPNR